MSTHQDITEETIRTYLLERAQAHSVKIKRKLSFISKAAVNDSKFLDRVASGKGFNMKTYRRVIEWLDQQDDAA